MTALSRLVALLLLALWLPATQHCAFEAAGLFAQSCADECFDGEDNCSTIEAGAYKPTTAALNAPAAMLVLSVAGVHPVVPRARMVAKIFPDTAARHRPAWVSTWHFVRRTALSPRAPSLLLA